MTNFSGIRPPFVLHTRVVTGTGGGPEKTILNSPRFLKDHGIDSACLFMRPQNDPGFETLKQKASDRSAEIIGVDDNGPLDRSVVDRCLKVCQERNVTVWHAHDYKSNVVGLLVRRRHPMHLVSTAHGWVRKTWKTPLYYAIDRFCLKKYQHVVCVSQDLYDACCRLRVRSERLHLIDNAIVAEDYHDSPATSEERSVFAVSDDRLLIGACGRLSEEKGFNLLISAVGTLVRDGANLGLIIAGEGHLKPTLQRQIDDAGMQEHIQLAGFLPDPRTLYRAIDVFALSSLREGLPNVVLEAMASGRPVLTTRVNGIPRLVSDGRNGLVIDCGSEQQLINGLSSLVDDPELRRRLGKEGRTTVETEFSFRHRMERMIQIYDSLSEFRVTRENSRSTEVALAATQPTAISRPESGRA